MHFRNVEEELTDCDDDTASAVDTWLTEIEEEKLLDGVARFRDVRVGPDGFIYLLTDAPNGALMRLTPAGTDSAVKP